MKWRKKYWGKGNRILTGKMTPFFLSEHKTYNSQKSLPPAKLNVSIHLLALRVESNGCGASATTHRRSVNSVNTNPNTLQCKKKICVRQTNQRCWRHWKEQQNALCTHMPKMKRKRKKEYIQQTSNWIRNGNWFPWDAVIHGTDNDGTENGNIFGWKWRAPTHGRRIARHDWRVNAICCVEIHQPVVVRSPVYSDTHFWIWRKHELRIHAHSDDNNRHRRGILFFFFCPLNSVCVDRESLLPIPLRLAFTLHS